MLDQSPNTKLHQEYSKKREELFTPFEIINREVFMNILAQIWNVWAPKDVIFNAAQRVGISSTGLDVRKMYQDKFEQAAKCMDTKSSQAPLCTPKKSLRSSFSTVVSPLTADSLSNTAKKKFRYGSSKYWPVYV